MTLAQRVDRIAKDASLPDPETVRRTIEQVDAAIADVAVGLSDEVKENMEPWWDRCYLLATRDPLLAKMYASMTPDDLAL
jgi:hypothetical protein